MVRNGTGTPGLLARSTGKHFLVKATTLDKAFAGLEALTGEIEPPREVLHWSFRSVSANGLDWRSWQAIKGFDKTRLHDFLNISLQGIELRSAKNFELHRAWFCPNISILSKIYYRRWYAKNIPRYTEEPEMVGGRSKVRRASESSFADYRGIVPSPASMFESSISSSKQGYRQDLITSRRVFHQDWIFCDQLQTIIQDGGQYQQQQTERGKPDQGG